MDRTKAPKTPKTPRAGRVNTRDITVKDNLGTKVRKISIRIDREKGTTNVTRDTITKSESAKVPRQLTKSIITDIEKVE